VVEVRLFGDLRRYVKGSRPATDTVLHLPMGEANTVGQVFARVGIDPAEVGNVFINGRLLPRSTYPITLGYRLVTEGPLTPERYLGTPIRTGDRVGIFPRNMSAVVV
jgi:hypothetical protein